GLPAALLMSNLQAAVRAFAQGGAEPAALCGNVNRLLCRHMVSGRFVTFCFAWIDEGERSLVYSNAGHNPPLLLRADATVERLAEGGVVMGVFPDAAFAQARVAVAAGDRLLFFTDGITEATDAAGEELGEARLAAIASAARERSADDLKDHVLEHLATFTGG